MDTKDEQEIKKILKKLPQNMGEEEAKKVVEAELSLANILFDMWVKSRKLNSTKHQ